MMLENQATKKVLEYIKENYDREAEFLWERSLNDAVFRHGGSLKWFGVLLNISKRKLGLPSEERANVLGLKCDSMLIGTLRGKKNYFPAYHMNKEHWISVLLDDETNLDELYPLIDMSFYSTQKQKRN